MGYVANYCKIALHFVKLYKEHGERHDTYVTHVEYTETLYDETTTYRFGHMESHTRYVDTVLDTLNSFCH